MTHLRLVCIAFGLVLGTLLLVITPAPAQPTDWNTSLRGPQLEAEYLHQLINDAKAQGAALDPAWFARLHELEGLSSSENLPDLPSHSNSVVPARSPIEDPFSPLEQQIQLLEMQLESSSMYSGDTLIISPELKAQLGELYAQRPENQRTRDPLDQGGDNCASVVDFGIVPNFEGGTTTGYANDFTSCGNSAPDVIYRFIPTFTGLHHINLCGWSAYDTRLEIRTGGACPGSTQLACIDDNCGLQEYVIMSLTSGVPYYIIVDGSGAGSGTYLLFISDAIWDPCQVPCPGNAVEECAEEEGLVNFGERDCNGGCDWLAWGAQAERFQTILPGQTVCGRYFSYQDSTYSGYWRDSDWYQFTIAEQCTVRWTAIGQVATYVRLRTGFCDGNFIAGNEANGCTPATTQAVLNPGTYYAQVFPGFSQIMYPLQYTATLTATPVGCSLAGHFLAPGSVDGNTCFASNRCNYRPSFDQRVQVTIPHYGQWRFSLCYGNLLWDSFIYLSTTCCGPVLASNDDACDFLSEINMCLDAGVYYITVEGWDASYCGSYTLRVDELQGSCCYTYGGTPQCQDGLTSCQCTDFGGTWTANQSCATNMCGTRPLCQDGASFGQQPHVSSEFWEGYASDDAIDYRLFDNFSGLFYPTTSVRFWATAGNTAYLPCVEQPQAITISFHADSAGWPRRANPAAQYNLIVEGTFLADYPIGSNNYAVYQYDATLPVPCTLTSGWISVQSRAASGNPDCRFWWISTPSGNNNHRLLWNNQFFQEVNSLAFCLLGQAPCASPLQTPQELTCNTRDVSGQRHIQLSWQALDAGAYEVWSTTVTGNDGNPDGGLDVMWEMEDRVNVVFNAGTQTWLDPHAITDLYKNYVVLEVCRPLGDACAGAVPISNGLTSYTNVGAGTDGPVPTCGGLGSDVWFSYTATCTGTVTVNTCTATTYDSAIEVFSGTCGNLGAPLTCNDDFCGLQTQVTFAATAGNTYLIRLGGFAGSQGDGTLNISCP